ncbi:MAG: hypothetical protein V3U75_12335 [Methylococcaceae bacterium]
MEIKHEYRWSLLLLLGCLALLIIIGAEWLYVEQYRIKFLSRINAVEGVAFDLDKVPEFNGLKKPISEYVKIANRPLFIEGRKPVPEEEKLDEGEVLAVVEDFDLSLIGVVSTPKGIFALMEDPKAKDRQDRFFKAKQNELIHDWEVAKIWNDKVIMRHDKEIKEVALAKPKPKKLPKKRAKPRRNPFANAKKNRRRSRPQNKIPPNPGKIPGANANLTRGLGNRSRTVTPRQ